MAPNFITITLTLCIRAGRPAVLIYEFHDWHLCIDLYFFYPFIYVQTYHHPTLQPALSWSKCSIGRALNWHCRGQDSNPHWGLNFSSLSRYYLSSIKNCEDHTDSFLSLFKIHKLLMVLMLVPSLALGNNKLPREAKRHPLFCFLFFSTSLVPSKEFLSSQTMHTFRSVEKECPPQ